MAMRSGNVMLVVAMMCAACTGCNAAKVVELTAQVQKLEAELQAVKAKNAAVESELAAAKAQLALIEPIRQGYEAARGKLQASLGALAPLLGNTGSPLPAFEDLKDPSWVGKLAPSPETAAGFKELQSTLQGLMAPPPAPAPAAPPPPQPAPRR